MNPANSAPAAAPAAAAAPAPAPAPAPAAALVETDAAALPDAAHDKAQRRKANNCKSAQKSRERGKQYLKYLEESVKQLQTDVADLKTQKDYLEVDNITLYHSVLSGRELYYADDTVYCFGAAGEKTPNAVLD